MNNPNYASTILLVLLLKFISFQHLALGQSVDHLKVLSLNTWGLPIVLPGSDQSKRFDAIVDSINAGDADIVCLQECFSKRLRKRISRSLNNKYRYYSDIMKSRREMLILNMDIHGGLITLSKHPIICEEFYRFPIIEDMNPEEKIGRKGFLFSQLETPVGIVNVINTHFHAGNYLHAECIRLEQLKYMYGILENMEDFYLYPTFLIGDLNINHPETLPLNDKLIKSFCYDYLTNEVGFLDSDSEIGRIGFTYDCFRNSYCDKKDGPQKLDYIFFHPMGSNTMEVANCSIRFDRDVKLSDHFGIEAVINFRTLGQSNYQILANKDAKSLKDREISP